ncbi:cobalt-precorrin-6A reductase [Chamaesiphon minutus]|uniref:Precorrin-6x reductase n=1 Tax=Chamaesiphon minutus (strain ATCC 27169 / PCC 6605) TaxID=1173020 RepID=K9U8Y7_CHAP6|nr:cobalt-precorrin-6A reductase [Chamaesiphon minutus]AFY91557.1 precorrin-6x reductase [Chamaesiphon minutus PCC 6605]
MKRLVIVGGTGDALQLAKRAILLQRGFANDLPGLEVITTLAGRTREPNSISGSVRIGGFGGEAGLIDYLQTEKIDLIIDATHPFAAQISWHVANAATEVGMPRLMLVRPAWTRSPEDNWIEVESIEAAIAAIPASAERIFVTIGRQQLAPFANLTDRWCLMRSIDPPDPSIPLPPGKLLLDRGPFNLEAERQLFKEYQIQAIVSKNSGGDATYAKIIAARELSLPVVMVQRPIVPDGELVADVAGAIEWLQQRL